MPRVLAFARSRFRQLVRYASVSAVSTSVSLLVLGLLAGPLGLAPVLANVAATAFGTVPSFELNRRWVWATAGPRSVRAQVVPFCALSFAGLGLSSAAVAVAARLSTGWGGGPRTLMVEGANLSAYGSLWVVQFVLLDRVLFARPRPRPPGPRSGLEGPAPGGAPPPPGDPRPRRGRGGPPGPRAPSPRPTPAEAARRMPAMPLYDYRCRTCEAVFEDRRPMAEADRPATCPAGHTGAARLLPVFATAGRAAPPGPGACGAPVAGGCGGACACHPG